MFLLRSKVCKLLKSHFEMGLPHLRGLVAVMLNLASQGEMVTVSLKGGVTECLSLF